MLQLNRPAFSRWISPRDLAGHDALRLDVGAGDPDVADLAALVADTTHRLAVAGVAGSPGELAGVAAGDLDLGGIHERIVELRIGDEHAIADRHKVIRAPDRPPAAGPIAHAAVKRAASPEHAQDLHGAIHPERRRAVDGVAEDADRELAARNRAGPGDVALKTAAMAEPVPAVCLAGVDAQAVIAFQTLRNAPMVSRHLTAARDREHALSCVGCKPPEEARGIGRGGDEACGGRHRVS